jgi:hypothetical protein
MTNSKSEPMVTNQVHTTKDYFLFKSIDGNRNKNLLHINRLKKSMQECYLFTVIIVNEKYEIIDGQHRFDVIEELKLPLNYIICKGYGLNEVHRLNTNSKTWNADDYLEGYCRLGYIDYITELMIKLKSQPTALQDCNDVSSYIALIEEIYNYRRREKVNLRY